MRHSTQNFIFNQVHKSKIFSYRQNRTEHQTYTADGRIHTSSAVGTYSYNSPTRYNLGGFNLTQSANDYINSRAQRNITYNMFQDPVRLEENTILTFQYNLKNQRSFVYKTQLNINVYCTYKNHVHPKITTNHSSDIGGGDFLLAFLC